MKREKTYGKSVKCGKDVVRRVVRYCFVFLILSTLDSQLSTLSAQHYIGVRGGYGGASGRFYPVHENSIFWNRYTGGVAWKFYSPQQIVGGVAAELEFQQRGYNIIDGIKSDTTFYTTHRRLVNSITAPLIWQPHIYMFNQRLRWFVNLGITFSYNLGIGDKMTVTSYEPGRKVVSQTTTGYKFITARDNRWNYGLCGGAGFGIMFGRCEVFAEARYYFGMSDIVRRWTKYTFQNDFMRSELDNLYINVGFYFRLGKGGIKEAPLRRNRDKQPDTNDFRNIKLSF